MSRMLFPSWAFASICIHLQSEPWGSWTEMEIEYVWMEIPHAASLQTLRSRPTSSPTCKCKCKPKPHNRHRFVGKHAAEEPSAAHQSVPIQSHYSGVHIPKLSTSHHYAILYQHGLEKHLPTYYDLGIEHKKPQLSDCAPIWESFHVPGSSLPPRKIPVTKLAH